ncbi:hypothetical protein C1Y40_05676 [Mycobacterium talmoniae]|uniref:Uncharacterized protein n=1 Tax=Mycobacterium talmoniae TaxID=1858794 RepID=A0A2S8BBY5_9MYCO|nr:hypothetical protein C1Y40_05676 [Mycobacterium talmoniae]
MAATSSGGASTARSRADSTTSTTSRIAGITTRRSRAAASRTSRACASEPPTRALGSTASTESRRAPTALNAAVLDGAASRITDHLVSPVGE